MIVFLFWQFDQRVSRCSLSLSAFSLRKKKQIETDCICARGLLPPGIPFGFISSVASRGSFPTADLRGSPSGRFASLRATFLPYSSRWVSYCVLLPALAGPRLRFALRGGHTQSDKLPIAATTSPCEVIRTKSALLYLIATSSIIIKLYKMGNRLPTANPLHRMTYGIRSLTMTTLGFDHSFFFCDIIDHLIFPDLFLCFISSGLIQFLIPLKFIPALDNSNHMTVPSFIHYFSLPFNNSKPGYLFLLYIISSIAYIYNTFC